MAAVDEAKYLQLAESLAGFRSKLRIRAEVLDIAVRQQILRLLVKEVLVGSDTITLRHSIRFRNRGRGQTDRRCHPSGVTGSRPSPGYLLRSGSRITLTSKPLSASRLRSLDKPVAAEVGEGGHDRGPLRRRCRAGIRAPEGRGSIPGAVAGADAEVRAG